MNFLVLVLIFCLSGQSFGLSCDNVYQEKIIAGQHIDAGDAKIYNTDGFLHLELTGRDGWQIKAVHVYIGDSGGSGDLGGSSLAPGSFNYTDEFEAASSRSVVLPLGPGCGNTLTVAVHTEMIKMVGFSVQQETGWVNGIPFTGSRWGFSFDYTTTCDCPDDSVFNENPDSHIEQCCSCGGDAQNNIPVGCEPTLTTPIYAGQTIHSGDLLIENGNPDENGGIADLTLSIQSTEGWLMTEIHIFIGTDYPGTLSPGKFSWQISFLEGIAYYKLHINIVDGFLVLDDGTKPELWNQKFDPTFDFGDDLRIAVHTTNIRVVRDGGGEGGDSSETGWAFGPWPIDPREKRWGWGLNYTFCKVQESTNSPSTSTSPSSSPSLPLGCTYTQGYWKTHNRYSKQPQKRINWPIDEDTMVCDQTYYQNLKTPPKGSTLLVLSHQYIAASLNVANGASSSEVDTFLSDASTLLNLCTEPTGESKTDALDISQKLDDYNNGLIGPGHCDSNTTFDSFCECRCVDQSSELPEFELNEGESIINNLKLGDDAGVELVLTSGSAELKKDKKRSLGTYVVVGTSSEVATGHLKITYPVRTDAPQTPKTSPYQLSTHTTTSSNHAGGANLADIIMGVTIGIVALAIVGLIVIIIIKKRKPKTPFYIMKEYK